MESLCQNMHALLAKCTGRWGIVITSKDGRMHFEWNPNMGFPAASMIKVPIMVSIIMQAAVGKLDLENRVTVGDEQITGGAGILKDLSPGHSFTIEELVTLMIILSDNTATNVLLDMISMDQVNETMASLGLCSTILQRKMMDFGAAEQGLENYTTAADMARLFTAIEEGNIGLPERWNAKMVDILRRQQIRDKLPFFLPEETVLAHKTGTLPGVEHDGGILYYPGGSCVVSVFSADLAANHEGLQLIASMGKCIYDHMIGEIEING